MADHKLGDGITVDGIGQRLTYPRVIKRRTFSIECVVIGTDLGSDLDFTGNLFFQGLEMLGNLVGLSTSPAL